MLICGKPEFFKGGAGLCPARVSLRQRLFKLARLRSLSLDVEGFDEVLNEHL